MGRPLWDCKGSRGDWLETRAIKADMTLFGFARFDLSFCGSCAQGREVAHYYVVIGQDKSIFISLIQILVSSWPRFPVSDLRKSGQVSIFMAPSPDYKPIRRKNRGPILLANLTQTAWLDYQYRPSDTLGDLYQYRGFLTIFSPSLIVTYQTRCVRRWVSSLLGLVIVYILQQILSYAQEYLLLVLGTTVVHRCDFVPHQACFHLPMSFLRHGGQEKSCLVLQMPTVLSMRWRRPFCRFS